MTKQHPLTDDLAESIAPGAHWSGDIGDTVFRHSDMRSAADWQLEQVIEWIRANDYPGYQSIYLQEKLIQELKKAMRPQEDTP